MFLGARFLGFLAVLRARMCCAISFTGFFGCFECEKSEKSLRSVLEVSERLFFRCESLFLGAVRL